MIPEVSREAILEAMERFDRELRHGEEWNGWEQKESHKYAINHNGSQYPVKKIISIATDTPVSSFGGGNEANTFVEKRGFDVTALRESVESEMSVRAILEQILAEYREARATGTFGGSHSIWQVFVKLQSAVENLPALKDHPELRVERSVGKGNWARVPWLAIIHAGEAEAPRRGVYCVFLFREDMTGVYAALNQGVIKPKEELGTVLARQHLRERAANIRAIVQNLQSRQFRLDNNIDLRSAGLGADYETSTIAYKLYESGHVPEDAVVSADLTALIQAYETALSDQLSSPPASGTNVSIATDQGKAPGGSQESQEFDRSSATQELIQEIESAGFIFEPWPDRCVYHGSKDKTFRHSRRRYRNWKVQVASRSRPPHWGTI